MSEAAADAPHAHDDRSHHPRLELADYRRRVAELYTEARARGSDTADAVARFREGRDELFARHAQSPLKPERREGFAGIPYYPYDPGVRFVSRLYGDGSGGTFEIALGDDGVLTLERVGTVRFELAGEPVALSLFWIGGYGGGLFLPFGDASNGADTFGGGRYLLDTIKGADLGTVHRDLILDFNYAYNPSCAYDADWVCPLAPPENRLQAPIVAGERMVVEAASTARPS